MRRTVFSSVFLLDPYDVTGVGLQLEPVGTMVQFLLFQKVMIMHNRIENHLVLYD